MSAVGTINESSLSRYRNLRGGTLACIVAWQCGQNLFGPKTAALPVPSVRRDRTRDFIGHPRYRQAGMERRMPRAGSRANGHGALFAGVNLPVAASKRKRNTRSRPLSGTITQRPLGRTPRDADASWSARYDAGPVALEGPQPARRRPAPHPPGWAAPLRCPSHSWPPP